MKKLFFFFLLSVGMLSFVQAQQISPNALGLRLGDSDGFGAEISYQRALGGSNRLEFDLGWRDSNNWDAFKLAGLYQWVMPLDGNFNWYLGAGGGLGSYDYNDQYAFDNNVDDSGTFIFAAGDVGIEYNFNIPLLLSLDFRPELGFGDFNSDLDFDIALGVRYQF
jgi:hypothetical protein